MEVAVCYTQPSREEARLATRGLLQVMLFWVLSPNPLTAFSVKSLESNLKKIMLCIPTDTRALPIVQFRRCDISRH